MTVETAGLFGRIAKSARVTTNDPTQREAVLRIFVDLGRPRVAVPRARAAQDSSSVDARPDPAHAR
jgi:hypothetical protein